ncbi:nuclear transport factor 2 family protein [Bradyrhizobium sp. CCGUVB1N3]|uniref:nuclear transport factor 2 family protein n=1 Tax=Bradyrhizobium sp. CCGUVB1N3 TaxID=2949629 RepID=UPI0020B1B0A6|nr:nuclear transport factor 2 family protein [Bradyrhizobium sp. CCGUVB1N3]MCP3473689.1 nuclear transport factor 2 family protein [Bradyrhizobium sp. CCGUVB1N3]
MTLTPADRATLIRNLFAAYLANDRARVADALAVNFRFTSPFDDNLDKQTYFERCWRDAGWIARHDIERIFIQGDEAFVTYRCLATDGKSFRNTEFMTFAGDRIARIDVYFGATYRDGAFLRQQG